MGHEAKIPLKCNEIFVRTLNLWCNFVDNMIK